MTLITNALDTSPTASLATLAAAVPALITAGGPYGIGLGVGVTAAALGVTYLGFIAVDVTTDRPLTFPAPKRVEEPLVDGESTLSTADVSVPDVIGKQYAEAEAELTEAYLNADSEEVESGKEPGTEVVVSMEAVSDDVLIGVVLVTVPGRRESGTDGFSGNAHGWRGPLDVGGSPAMTSPESETLADSELHGVRVGVRSSVSAARSVR